MNNLDNTNNTVQSLLAWYKLNKRDLPWRQTKDPYRIWLSEVMLQQTQVETVIPYYERWVKKYPNISDVMESKESDLLKLWEGLGYYNRCRNFHKAIRTIASDFDGNIPDKKDDLLKLPGVGNYIASAVLSISFGQNHPALNGNIIRVMSRLLRKKIDSSYNRKIIHNHILKWMNYYHPGDINEALMDLGSTICRSNQTNCNQCPLVNNCGAYTAGNPETYPKHLTKKKTPEYNVVTGVVWKNDKFLIMLRDNKKHLGGLWEFPGGKIKNGENQIEALGREIKEECGLDVNIENKIGSFKHVYSHFSINMTSFHCKIKNGSRLKTQQSHNWIDPSQINDFVFPKANHKIFSLMLKE